MEFIDTITVIYKKAMASFQSKREGETKIKITLNVLMYCQNTHSKVCYGAKFSPQTWGI